VCGDNREVSVTPPLTVRRDTLPDQGLINAITDAANTATKLKTRRKGVSGVIPLNAICSGVVI
jgi:hypothetical protein